MRKTGRIVFSAKLPQTAYRLIWDEQVLTRIHSRSRSPPWQAIDACACGEKEERVLHPVNIVAKTLVTAIEAAVTVAWITPSA
jgi:hypothetical protein